MAVFPTTLYPQFGYQSRQMENVKRNASKGGNTQIIDLWGGVTRFTAEMVFDLRTKDGLAVYKFWKQNRTQSFTFYDYDDDIYLNTSLGFGNGVMAAFSFPAKAVHDYSILVGGVLKTLGVHYNLSANTGPAGQDQVVFTGGNIPGALVEVLAPEFQGHGGFSCHFNSEPTKETNARGRQLHRYSVLED